MMNVKGCQCIVDGKVMLLECESGAKPHELVIFFVKTGLFNIM